MTTGHLARLLRWYPPAWRERYGAELAAYMEDSFGSRRLPWRTRLSLVIGGLRERSRLCGLTGDSASRPERLRTAVLVVLCSWTGFVLAGSSFAKLSEHFDEALPNGRGGHHIADVTYSTIQVAATVAGIIVIAGAVLALRSFVRFLRSGGWPAIRRHVVVATACTILAAGVTVPMLLWAHHLSDHQRNGGLGGYGVLFLTWAVLVAVTLALWTVVAVAAARRVIFSRLLLVAEATLAVTVATAMVVILAATAIWWAAVDDQAPSFLPTDPRLIATVGFMALASATAMGGAIRAFRAWANPAPT
jgi:hypothetical protein